MLVIGGAIVQPDMQNVAESLAEEWEPRSEILTFNEIHSSLLSFNTPYNVIIKLFYCDSPRKKLKSPFNQAGYINTYFASAIKGIISVQLGYVCMTEVNVILQCRDDI